MNLCLSGYKSHPFLIFLQVAEFTSQDKSKLLDVGLWVQGPVDEGSSCHSASVTGGVTAALGFLLNPRTYNDDHFASFFLKHVYKGRKIPTVTQGSRCLAVAPRRLLQEQDPGQESPDILLPK